MKTYHILATFFVPEYPEVNYMEWFRFRAHSQKEAYNHAKEALEYYDAIFYTIVVHPEFH